MKTRKGPYGHFLVSTLDENETIYEYAMKIIESGQIEDLIPVFLDERKNSLELSFDYSGLSSITDYVKDQKEINVITRRYAIRELFCLFLTLLNNLLPLENLVLEAKYIFFDDKQNKIKLCYQPFIANNTLELSGLDSGKIETLLNHEFFSSCLDTDEITSLIYAIKNNDETLLNEIFIQDPNLTIKKKEVDTERITYRFLLIFSALCTIFLLLIKRNEYAIFLSLVTLGLYIKVAYDDRKDKKYTKKNKSNPNLKSKRAEILFEKEPTKLLDANDLFSYACLESTSLINGERIKYGLYSDETLIGSDRFVSDVYIDDKKISELHAKIIHEDNTYWLIDLSKQNNTYLENRSLKPDTKYEIKNGQIIRFGDFEFTFKIGY